MLKRIITLFRCVLFVIRPTSNRSFFISLNTLVYMNTNDLKDIIINAEDELCLWHDCNLRKIPNWRDERLIRHG